MKRIQNNEAPAAYLIAKQIDAGVDVQVEELDALWEAHGEALQRFAERRIMLDEGYETDEDVPVHSLLDLKMELADRFIRRCGLCEKQCYVDRSVRSDGKCRVGYFPLIVRAAVDPETAEEISPALSVYFSGCNFTCFYCNAHEMAFHPERGEEWVPGHLSLKIEENIGAARALKFTGGEPAINVHYIIAALQELELNTPVAIHTNGYWTPEIGSLLEGVIDLAIVDFKFGQGPCAQRMADAENYFQVLTRNLTNAQTYDVLVRHVAIPGHIDCCTQPVLQWVSTEVDRRRLGAIATPEAPWANAGFDLQVLFNYEPAADALKRPEYSRLISDDERERATAYAKSLQQSS